jgi:hypothetical protein
VARRSRAMVGACNISNEKASIGRGFVDRPIELRFRLFICKRLAALLLYERIDCVSSRTKPPRLFHSCPRLASQAGEKYMSRSTMLCAHSVMSADDGGRRASKKNSYTPCHELDPFEMSFRLLVRNVSRRSRAHDIVAGF